MAAVFGLARPNFGGVAVQQMYEGHVADLIQALEPGGDQHSGHHIWVVVADDIDPANTEEVRWAIASRCIPETAVTLVPGTAVWQLDPRIAPGARSKPTGQAGSATKRTAR
ncbi:MAG TPA: hypothetical protein VFC51_17300 [Chloroflexota bacterium]|nr:hypothetical protein [Chloroflexota bacterium]